MNELYIIVNLINKQALYGANTKTLIFSSKLTAKEFASQMFERNNEYLIIPLRNLISES